MRNYFRYWGKARREGEDGPAFHLLPYHCLDVAAVADAWWQSSKALRRTLCIQSKLSETQTHAWVMFFVALHDLGKFDVRFQIKARDVALNLWCAFEQSDPGAAGNYAHGPEGLSSFFHDFSKQRGFSNNPERFDMWLPWLAAVAGHHGVIPSHVGESRENFAAPEVIAHDRESRISFIQTMAQIFLQPADLTMEMIPPPCNQSFLAGFCAVADWLGSNEDWFKYEAGKTDLPEYFKSRASCAINAVEQSGICQSSATYGGVQQLLPEKCTARQVQRLVDGLPLKAGLTLIEAPTGSGKTEAALAYAWRLLDHGLAESIIFALPTQATANAMFQRLTIIASQLFPGISNVVLAHGKASLSGKFRILVRRPEDLTCQGREEAGVQCSKWLANSRKRVFLGQIGVCTVDQVLISVLPVRHKFVRGFGLGKSVLIIDEVHAYDRYMYGLLDEVLHAQRIAGGSAVLLSATLPLRQRKDLVKAWDPTRKEKIMRTDYPLITHVNVDANIDLFSLNDQEQSGIPRRCLNIALVQTEDIRPGQPLLRSIIAAAEHDAAVAVICNLVADAQQIAGQLRAATDAPVDLFHSRFRFIDRQKKETSVLDQFGPKVKRSGGRILVATQVIEQSLDLDFDWMVSQICPVDLLFQRLGRLHRHGRDRPEGYEDPQCTVLLPVNEDYQLHKVIYGNTRVLWRTRKMLESCSSINFPDVYRPWIERVYEDEPWENEPKTIDLQYAEYDMEQRCSWRIAKQLANEDVRVFADTDSNLSRLTRDGEMSLNVVPVTGACKKGRCFLEGTPLTSISEWQLDEQLSLNTIPVPNSWRKYLSKPEDGIFFLEMATAADGSWTSQNMRYDKENGLEVTIS